MDPFTKRMLERAKARREKLDTQLSNAGHEIRPRRSPLKDANAIVLQASRQYSYKINPPSSIKNAKSFNPFPELSSSLNTTTNSTQESFNITTESSFKAPGTPEKSKKCSEEVTNKENGSQMMSSVKSKLERLGKLYSDDESRELSSPIHRTEETFSAEESSIDEYKSTKRHGARLDRLAALASTINNWEDDLSHPQLVKKDESKAEKIQAQINDKVKGVSAECQPSTSGYSRWKSNGNSGKNSDSNLTRNFKWDKKIITNLEPKTPEKTPEKSVGVEKRVDIPKLLSKTPDKGDRNSNTSSSSGNRSGNRFGGYSGSSKNIITSPGSVLSKASLFESKSVATKAKDPAEMSLSERMALFERNKGEALIPKAPLTLSVPTNKLQEPSKSFNQSGKNDSLNKSVMKSKELFEKGLPKQELENDILRDTQTERQKELTMLRSRFNKNKESVQVAAESCIRPRKNSENTANGSPKNSPVCPVKPTPASDHIPVPPPLPQGSTTPKKQEEKVSAKRQVIRSPSQSQHQSKQAVSEVKRFKVSLSKAEHLYPDLSGLTESTDTDTTDGEFTIASTEPDTVTLEEGSDKSDSDFDTDDYTQEEGNTSFETSILKVVTRQTIANKRQIESDAESSTSDISVLDEMDEYLDECLANQESHGPTPPKLNREAASPSTASSSFKYSAGFRSPIKVTSRSSIKNQPYIVEGDNHVPLMYSLSSYRRQQSTPNKTPVKQVSKLAMDESREIEPQAHGISQEASLVGDKIKRLMDEVCKQQTIIGQASQALNLCTATVEFSGSREQVEGERLLLIATHRRQAALNEIQRLKIEGTLRPAVPGESIVQESGSLTISALTLPLKKDYHGNRDMCLHFLCLIRHLDVIIATPVVQAELGDSCCRFPSTLKLDNLYSDFKITIEVYSLETRAEILPHEIKYHIHTNIGHNGSGASSKKAGGKTPKKLQKQEKLIMPSVQSPAGPGAVRSPAFALSGYVVFSLREVNRQQFTLNKVPRNSSLEGHLQMHVSCELSIAVEHRGFLTMFEDVSGFGAWHRRWCLLKGDTLSYWKYPDDERKKTPIGSIELQGVVTNNVGLVSRDICARPNTFLLETVRPTQPGDEESMIVIKNGPLTTIKHLLSADTKEERLEWCSKLNKTLNLIRAWGGGTPGY
ncbi:anillin-like isoform X3 [Chelonus insularis]|uniref:anillin-like isoform X3 n=1 Tax=Chelonus insularis TaxID=460826 RepID=UPI00158D1084|nr:anillin-like isoform X3 [Chelonus insularis]